MSNPAENNASVNAANRLEKFSQLAQAARLEAAPPVNVLGGVLDALRVRRAVAPVRDWALDWIACGAAAVAAVAALVVLNDWQPVDDDWLATLSPFVYLLQ